MLIDITPLWIPMPSQGVMIQLLNLHMEQGIIHLNQSISNNGKNATGFQGTLYLGIKGLKVKPVYGLRHGNQIKAMVGKGGFRQVEPDN